MDVGLSIRISFQRFETEENWDVLRLYEGLGEDKNLTGETPKGGAGVCAFNDRFSFHFGEQLRSQAPPLLRPSGCCQIERLLCSVPMTTTTCRGSKPPTEPPTSPACQVLCSPAFDLKPFPVRGSVCVYSLCVFSDEQKLACTFEEGMCFWRQQPDDDGDWIQTRGATFPPLSGPSMDHTLGNSSGASLYKRPCDLAFTLVMSHPHESN